MPTRGKITETPISHFSRSIAFDPRPPPPPEMLMVPHLVVTWLREFDIMIFKKLMACYSVVHYVGEMDNRYIMALVDTLNYFPEEYLSRERLLSYLQSSIYVVVTS